MTPVSLLRLQLLVNSQPAKERSQERAEEMGQGERGAGRRERMRSPGTPHEGFSGTPKAGAGAESWFLQVWFSNLLDRTPGMKNPKTFVISNPRLQLSRELVSQINSVP